MATAPDPQQLPVQFSQLDPHAQSIWGCVMSPPGTTLRSRKPPTGTQTNQPDRYSPPAT